MAVTVSDNCSPHPNKLSRFVGICIDRGGTGLRAWFILRNVIEGQVWLFIFIYLPSKNLLTGFLQHKVLPSTTPGREISNRQPDVFIVFKLLQLWVDMTRVNWINDSNNPIINFVGQLWFFRELSSCTTCTIQLWSKSRFWGWRRG